MPASLCIHGHFYQPPREDPWLGNVLVEASAAPMRNWNERILRESYAPLAWARRLDDRGRIADVINCYEWINFNVGPTLMHWLRAQSPETLLRMRQGDTLSRQRLGHGNAMAQVYHHVIMPLASERDKLLETAWAIDDFRFHFGRAPEGMWLAECAVDSASLEVLAARGISFVILAPRQAKAVIIDGERMPVNEGSLDIRVPYRVLLPSGASLTAVFYHGALSQSIAFEGLLRDGELFWRRIAAEANSMAASSRTPPLLCLATDGETYGHHFTFGEMALAHVLAQAAAQRDNIGITNIAAHVAANPPVSQVVLHEPSSWSCVHGVERWRSDCGCTDGGHPGWNQQWRGPLRDALNIMRRAVDAHYNAVGGECFTDPDAALVDYGRVLADPGQRDAFAGTWFTPQARGNDRAWKLLAMQEQALAAFASCAWFFDDIARIEPENAMTFALRALDLMRESGGPDIEDELLAGLEKARSNMPEQGSGKEVFQHEVLPRRDDAATLCLLAWLLEYGGMPHGIAAPARRVWSDVSVELLPEGPADPDQPYGAQKGRAVIRDRHAEIGTGYFWKLRPPTGRYLPGTAFTCLAEAAIELWADNGSGQPDRAVPEFSRAVAELSRPMRDYLLDKVLENRERHSRPELRAAAAHALSLADPWLEAQHDVVRPGYWVGFIPYILLEHMTNGSLHDNRREQIRNLYSLHLSSRDKTLARQLAQGSLLDALAENAKAPEGAAPYTDDVLAGWVRRARSVMPDMDWWEAQNTLWAIGREQYPALSAELGFL